MLMLEPHFSAWISKISWDTEGFLSVQNCCGNGPSYGPWVKSPEVCPAIWMALMFNSCCQNKSSCSDEWCWNQFWRNSSASQTDRFPRKFCGVLQVGAWWGAERADVLVGGGSLLVLAWDFLFLQKEGILIWYHLSLSTDGLQCSPGKITAITVDIIFI